MPNDKQLCPTCRRPNSLNAQRAFCTGGLTGRARWFADLDEFTRKFGSLCSALELDFALDLGWFVLERALELGADPNQYDQGTTPLIHACSAFNTGYIRILLEHKADPNCKDESGDTPLIILVSSSQSGDDIMWDGANSPDRLYGIQLLLDHGADLSLSGDEGKTALHHAADQYDNDQLVAFLLKAGANPMIRDHHGRLAVEYARCSRGYGRLQETTVCLLERAMRNMT